MIQKNRFTSTLLGTMMIRRNWSAPTKDGSSIFRVCSPDYNVYTTVLDPSAIDKTEQVNTQWIKAVAPHLGLLVNQPYAVLYERAEKLAERIDRGNKTRINQAKNSDPESPAARISTATTKRINQAKNSDPESPAAPTSTAPTSTAPTSTVPTSTPKKKRARRK
jgi:hypothetical protein